MHFRNDIQGLRAVAFLLVFIFHLNKEWLPGGFIGVDLFFILSGYLMTNIILNDIEEKKFSFKTFFIKRAKRILPAYYFLLIIIAVLGSYWFLYTDIEKLSQSLLRAGSFTSNLFFARGESYFGAKISENPLLHTWSLSIEMQFYLFLPFLIFFFKKHLSKIFIFLIVILTAFYSYKIFFSYNKTGIYFSLLGRIPEFLIGGFYAIKFKKGIDFNRNTNNLFALSNFAILIACAFFLTESSPFPGITALLPCIASANLLIIKNNFLSTLLSKKLPVYIGELSYSLYLWHWPIMAFIRYNNSSYFFSNIEIAYISILTLLLAWLSYYMIEKKLRYIKTKKLGFILVPSLVLFIFFCINMKNLTISKEIPELYSKPNFGLRSHNSITPEKYGDINKNDSILLIGDSHALSIKPFLDYIGRHNHFSFSTLTCDSYIALEGIKKEEIPSDDLRFFYYSRSLVMPTEKLIKRNKIIIINSIGFERIPSLYTSLDKFIKNLKSDQKLILINTFPKLDKNPLLATKNLTYDHKTHIKNIWNNENKKILENFAQKYSNVYLYDLSKSNVFNTPGFINDTIAYYDPNHINTFGSLKLAEDLNSDFMKFFNKIHNR